MAYILYYNLEFDTVKGRRVKLEIEKERNVPPASETFIGYNFNSIGGQNIISISNAITTDNLPNYIYKYDKLTITGTSSNNSTYTVESYRTYIDAGIFWAEIIVSESVVFEFGSGIDIVVTMPSVVNLIASGQSPVELSYPNGEFEKMNPIRESKMRIKILTKNVNYEDFTILYDTQFKVKLYVNDTLEWLGWLDNDYITEAFLDIPVELELSANDGLSMLKTKNLVDSVEQQIWDKISINNLLAVLLYHTKLELNYSTYINLYPTGSQIRVANTQLNDVFNYAFVYAHTFLKGPRDFDDCYQVLSKIMQSFGCTLFQARGQWYIIQTNDRIANVLDGTNRDYTGSNLSVSLNQSFKINIGLNEATKLINADALVSIEKPFKEVALKYKFERPPIYFRNWDLLDGILDNAKSTATRKIYELQHWLPCETWNQIVPGQINVNRKAYVAADINTTINAEIRRYMVLYRNNTGFSETAIKTTRYPVNGGDIINVGFSARLNIALIPNRYIFYKCVVKLIGNNGTNYYLAGGDANWYTNFQALVKTHDTNYDTRLWSDFFGGNSKPIPVSGLIELEFTSHGAEDATEVHFKDITFEINGRFQEQITVDAFEFKSESLQNIRNKYDNDIFISTSPNISNTGSIISSSASPTSIDYWNYKNTNINIPFLQYITRAYWRTMWRNFMRIEGRLYDLYQGNRLLSPLNSIEFTEFEDKEFMLTTLQMDLRQETSEFTMIELRDISNTNDFTQNGTESFRYLNVRAKDENDPLKEPRFPVDWKLGVFGVLQSLIRRKKMRRYNNYQ
jgi:hypothetical protein